MTDRTDFSIDQRLNTPNRTKMPKNNFKILYIGLLTLLMGSLNCAGLETRAGKGDAASESEETVLPSLRGKVVRSSREAANAFAQDLLLKVQEQSPQISTLVQQYHDAEADLKNGIMTASILRAVEELLHNNPKALWITARLGGFLLSIQGADNSWIGEIYGNLGRELKFNSVMGEAGIFPVAMANLAGEKEVGQVAASQEISITDFLNCFKGAAKYYKAAAVDEFEFSKDQARVLHYQGYAVPSALQILNKAMRRHVRGLQKANISEESPIVWLLKRAVIVGIPAGVAAVSYARWMKTTRQG